MALPAEQLGPCVDDALHWRAWTVVFLTILNVQPALASVLLANTVRNAVFNGMQRHHIYIISFMHFK
jgi:hypothetical protein